MRRYWITIKLLAAVVGVSLAAACSTAYVEKPLSFKMPDAYANRQEFGGAVFGARAFTDSKEAGENFGFNVIDAGMLPVEIVIDNKGPHPLEFNGSQAFLEDQNGNLWPVLRQDLAYERATKYAQTHETFKGAAQSGFFGAAAGAAVGAAIGILSGHDIGNVIGKGAALGAIGGGLVGGSEAYQSGDARRAISEDLRQKSLTAKAVAPNTLSYGFMFFPAEAKTARMLRVQVIEKDTGRTAVLTFGL